MSLFKDNSQLSSFEDMHTMSSNEDGVDVMPEEFTLTGWSKLGGLVRDTRLSQGLSQSALAARAGVARSWLARVEAGHRGAELEPLLRLLAALDLTLTLRSNSDEPQARPSPDRSRAVSGREPSTHRDPPDAVGAALRADSQARRASWGLPGAGSGDDRDD
ncbi:helix-turn-helix transcriptional regulator [Nocardiopsis sp. RSe5-2]|uniref:Helix-turn-helix transcriptional regulator n=1 Tax=Nocardiopsis endophytica TaxID=3018445 RepID=A0ABT4U870_9ACTN|nr:helix-turn-helix transcriptional regulator [Nocardiopsis endophytica]MDA2813150.1 helix-turn-helix transcriptional regulator [Nocardiopsis endophytica]